MPLNIPAVPLQYFLIAHFVLVTWASLYPWLQEVYIFTNYFVLILGLWVLKDKTSKEPVQFMLGGHLFTVLNDIILLSMYFGDNQNSISNVASRFKFTAAMAIINLLLKPVSALFMYKEWQDRQGDVQYEDLGPQTGASSAPTKQAPVAPPGYMPPSSAGYMPPSSANNPYQSGQY